MLVGAHLGGASLASVLMGLHHGLCHVLGGSAGVPHGLANAIILPHAMRFNLDATAPQLAQAAAAMGLAVAGQSDEAAGEAAAQHVYNLVSQLGLPQRLRDAGVKQADLPQLAQLALKSSAVQSNPKPLTDAAQAEAIFRAAW
jgi:alcohol dehydrogenase